jgi:hypothetical protein
MNVNVRFLRLSILLNPSYKLEVTVFRPFENGRQNKSTFVISGLTYPRTLLNSHRQGTLWRTIGKGELETPLSGNIR